MAADRADSPQQPDSTVVDELPEYSIDNSISSDTRIVLRLKRRLRSPSPPTLLPYNVVPCLVASNRKPPKLRRQDQR